MAARLLDGERFQPSQNDYDWLGHGIYFWEYGLARARRFAVQQAERGKLRQATVVGALLQLGNCFDLMDVKFTRSIPAHNAGVTDEKAKEERRQALLKMRALSSDQLLRLAIRAGIYTEHGDLAEPYKNQSDPSPSRPND